MLRSILLPFLACASVVTGQFAGILSLSDSCNKALGQILVGGPAANCLNTPGLLNVLTTPSGQSWVPPYDSYLTTTCGQPACTNETITETVQSLKDGCSSDLAAKGWSADDISSILMKYARYYPPTREVMCLRDTANDQRLCMTTIFRQVEEMTGQPLNAGTLIANLPTILRDHKITIPKNISCTQCTQAAYTIARPNLPSDSSVQAWDNFWIGQCGETFISGIIPTSISQTANQTTETETPKPSNAQQAAMPSPVLFFGSLAIILVSMLSIIARG